MLQLRAGRCGQLADGHRAHRAPGTEEALHCALPHLARLLRLHLQRSEPATSRREVIHNKQYLQIERLSWVCVTSIFSYIAAIAVCYDAMSRGMARSMQHKQEDQST